MIRSVRKILSLTALSVAAVLVPLSASAAPALFEGPITDVGAAGETITVMGVTISVSTDVPISSPTAPLTSAQLADTEALPNRSQPGFIGGTAIVEGISVDGFVNATSVFVEPAENVALGELTIAPGVTLCEATGAPEPGDLLLNGIELSLIDDPRIPFAGATDPNGFAIDVCDVTPGPAAVEGYFSGGYLNVFAMEATAILPPGADQVSIERARCRDGRLEVRGATTGDDGSVRISEPVDGGGQVNIAIVNVTPDGLGGGTYRLRIGLSLCPDNVKVEWLSPTNELRAQAETAL